MDTSLKDKIIMVAAGSKGLGYGIAEACAKAGACVSIASRSEANIRAAVTTLGQHGAVIHGMVFDARDRDSIDAWAAEVLKQFGRVDGLVINAGGPPLGRFTDFDESDWYNAFDLTLMSAVRMIHAVLPTMKQQRQGAILTVTSMSIKEPIEQILLSNVMRSGVVSLVKSLSKDVAKEGVRVNNLVPGKIFTDRVKALNEKISAENATPIEAVAQASQSEIPIGRYGLPSEFGNAGAFLLSDAASYITGATLMVDGGLSRTVW